MAFGTTLILTAFSALPALAQGAVVDSFIGGIGPIDDPCTPNTIESIVLLGKVQSVETPSGVGLYHAVLQSSNPEYQVVEVYSSKLNETTYFNQLLVSKSGTGNFIVSGIIYPDQSLSYTTRCTK